MTFTRIVFFSLAAAAATTQSADAIPLYVFDSLVEAPAGSPGGSDPLNRRPSIADDGSAVFAERYLDGGEVRERIRIVEEDGSSRIAVDEASITLDLDFATNPVISDDGIYTSFAATDGNGLYGIYRVDDAGLVTRIARQGDLDAKGNTMDFLSCQTGCPVSNFKAPGPQGEPTLDGRVVFNTPNDPGANKANGLAAGRGGVANRLVSSTVPILGMHQANTGQVYFTTGGFDAVQSTIDGSAHTTLLLGNSGHNEFGDVAVETFATAPMTATVFTAEETVTGTKVLLQRDEFGDFVEVATEVGPYASFRDVSINKSQNILFGADLDVQGSGIFTGPNPGQNRVIGPGDVLFGKLVTSVGIQKAEALNDDDDITLWVELDDGTQHILRGQTLGDFLYDQHAQISLPGGSTALSTVLNGGTRTSFGLEVGLEFLTGSGFLDLMLGDTLLGTARAESLPTDGIFRLSGISPTPFLEADRLGEDPVFSILFKSQDPASIRLNDLNFFDDTGALLDIVRNGDFENGYLTGWDFDGPDGSTAFVKAVATTPVPLPAGLPLLVAGMGAFIIVRRRSLT